jgi:hypothetical protein
MTLLELNIIKDDIAKRIPGKMPTMWFNVTLITGERFEAASVVPLREQIVVISRDDRPPTYVTASAIVSLELESVVERP